MKDLWSILFLDACACCKTSEIFLLSKNKSGWWSLDRFTEKVIFSGFFNNVESNKPAFCQITNLTRSLFKLTEVISRDSTLSNGDIPSAYNKGFVLRISVISLM
jgi:hypothetical protein